MKTEVFKNEKIEMLNKFVQNTDVHIFLTGKAGTGKTTFLRNLAVSSTKRMVIVAPTGVAAINAGGVTIHSFFQLPFGPIIPESQQVESPSRQVSMSPSHSHSHSHSHSQHPIAKINSVKRKIMRSLDLLVIDEISMVRADLLDAIDSVLRKIRHDERPFGGVQLLMIGDIQQLAPVARQNEWELLQPYYKSVYFFDSIVLQNNPYICIELDHIYRQNDATFINILNQVRNNCLDAEYLNILNSRYNPDFVTDDKDGYITLTTHNSQADEINDEKLEALKSKRLTFIAEVKGIFPENAYPTKESLELKVGAQVMFVKNDPSMEKRYYNGKIGVITSYDKKEGLKVRCDDDIIDVTPVIWQNMEYSINAETKEIEEKEIGSFTQIPLRTAWAITIHKSQGLTFDKVVLDAEMAFAHGQVYVALSRCTSLNGLVLKSKISHNVIFNDRVINNFVNKMPEIYPDNNRLEREKKSYLQRLVTELFSFNEIEIQMNRLAKVLRENDNIIEKRSVDKIIEMRQRFRTEVIDVSLRFQRQLESIFYHNDSSFLQERIMKASPYFFEKMNELENISDYINETDNKAVNLSIKGILDILKETLFVKTACLDLSTKGFDVEKYLEIKNKKTVEAEDVKPSRLKGKALNKEDKKLMNKLLSWREEKADELGKTENQIIPKTVLTKIAELKPVTIKELKNIARLGASRIRSFGADIVNIVLNFQGYEESSFDDKESIMELNVSNSAVITKELFDEGFDIEEVMAERSLSRSTIENHIVELVKNGIYRVEGFIDEEKAAIIREYFIETQDASLSAARDVLGEDYSYFELRLVRDSLH